MPRGFIGGSPTAPHVFNQLQGSLWTELSRRLFGGARTPTVAPEISVNVELFSRPELWALHAGSLLMGRVTGLAAGGAGNRSQISVSMIPATRSIAIVERVVFAPATAEGLVLSLSQVELTSSTGNLVTRDTRRVVTVGGSAPATCRIRTQNNAGLGGSIATEILLLQIPALNSTTIELDLVLGPGWSLRIYPTADNVAIASNVNVFVRERVCTPDELAVL